MTAPGPDTRLVRATAVRLGLQAAALVAVTVFALIGLASLVVLHAQNTARESLLHTAATTANDVVDPPAGVWLTIRRGNTQESSPAIPPGLPIPTDLNAALVSHTTIEHDVHLKNREFRVLTISTAEGTIQASLDLRADHAERGRLISALIAGGLGGLIMAVVVGALLGRRAVRPLSDALALQRRFVADASHELRTPLTLLSMRAQMMLRGLASGRSAEQIQADAIGVVSDAQHLGSIVEDLLAAADPRADTSAVDLSGLLDAIAESTIAYAQERHVTVRVDSPAELSVPGQEASLRRAITALVDNAIQHSPAYGVVSLKAHRSRGHRARIDVIDEGSGIDPGRRNEILGRFHSEATTTGRRRYGLGLSLADEVVSRHGGHLEITPGPDGHGSCFTLIMPA